MQDELQKAFDAYKSDSKQLCDIGKNLLAKLRKKPNAAVLKTIEAQLTKIEAEGKDAQQRYFAKVDGISESVVKKIRALAALGASHSCGARLLLDECGDFGAASGNFAKRAALFNGIIDLLESVADAECKEILDTVTFTNPKPIGDQKPENWNTAVIHARPNFKF
jgi:hypothetical protein